MHSIKACVYDLEGTVVNVETAHHKAHILAAKDVGVALSLEECFRKIPHFIGGPDDAVAKDIADLARKKGITADYISILKNDQQKYESLLQTESIEPRQGFLNFFHTTKNMGMKYAIGSLTEEKYAKVLLEKSGLDKLFGQENIVLRHHVKDPKPAPDVWIETAMRTGVDIPNQLVFEDSPRGIRGAVEVGIYCVGMPVYNRPDTVTDLMNAGARRIFMNWDEINPGALISNINMELSLKNPY